jgi:MFS family permease
MFLQYAAPGAVLQVYTLRLEELDFSPLQMGLACSTQAMACLAVPLIAGQVADRWYPAERCLAVCALMAGVLLWLLAGLTSPPAVFLTSLAAWAMIVPTLTLGITLGFAHLRAPEREFGRVRLWGTVGWVASGLLLGYWFSNPEWLRGGLAFLRPALPHSERADAFRLAGLGAFILAAYALTLPRTPPSHRLDAWLAPLAAAHLLWDRTFAVYCFCLLGATATIPFTTQNTPLLLEHLGVPLEWVVPTTTIAQSTEVLSLAFLPVVLLRLGLRGTMLLGLGAWAVALSVLTVGRPLWLVVLSQTLNGLCISCFFVAGQVFVNSRAHGHIRASAQALLTVTTGLGMLIGNLLSGWVRQEARGAFGPTFGVAAVIAASLTAFFLTGFRPERTVLAAGGKAEKG